MKRHPLNAAVFLSLCWLLSGCPQAAQTLAPGTFNAVDAPSIDSPSDEPSDEPPPSDPQADVRANPPGDVKEVGHRKIYATADPIDSKGDTRPIDPIKTWIDARLRYGTNSKILPKSPPVEYPLAEVPAEVTLRFLMDTTVDPIPAIAHWYPLKKPSDDKLPLQLRVVYVPKGGGEAKYCDAVWELTQHGRVRFLFPDITIGKGELRFFAYHLVHGSLTGPTTFEEKTPDFHTGDLIPLETGDASKPFPDGLGGGFVALGSFKTTATEP
jgi:hypothetical protein